MKRRPGITLVEVLIAIFIMSIGLLALLTLFPLGALRMAQALQDDRAAAAANAGANICDAFGLRADAQYDPQLAANAPPGALPLFATPPPPPAGMPNLNTPPTAQTGPGYPIYVDPFGSVNNSTLGYSNTTHLATPGIWRVSPSVIPAPYNTAPAVAPRYFSLPDDVTFGTNGLPDPSSGYVQRGGRYTWAYLLHRLQPYTPSSLVDLAVVVYAGRATSVAGGENTYDAPIDPQGVANIPNSTSVLLQYSGAAPDIRRGTWILDTSYNAVNFSVHGDFYRVVSVTQGGGNTLNLELQIPLSKPLSAVTVLDNVVEVFERGTDQSNRWEINREQQP